MGLSRPLIGLTAAAALLTGFDQESYADTPGKSPLLHDIGSPSGLFEQMRTDPALQLGTAQQVLEALQEAIQSGTRKPESGSHAFALELPRSEGSFTVNAIPGRAYTVSAYTTVEAGSPYVYADNITITLPECNVSGRSNLTMGNRTKDGDSRVNQTVLSYGNDLARSEVSAMFNGETLSLPVEEHQEQLGRYNEAVNQLACTVKASLAKATGSF